MDPAATTDDASSSLTPDRNKTQTTRELTAAVISWLDGHGFKPVETECFVAPGWQADIATMIDPTRTEATKLKLIPPARRGYEAHHLAFKLLPSLITALVEVKVSISDLKQDRKWTLPAPADICIVAVPVELATLTIAHVPARWGVLQVSGDCARVLRWPPLVPATVDERLTLVYEVALRRDHRTRYAALRETQKQARVRDNVERVTPARWNRVAQVVLKIANGGGPFYNSVEEVLRANSVTGLSGWVIEQLEKLWGIAVPGTAAGNGDGISDAD